MSLKHVLVTGLLFGGLVGNAAAGDNAPVIVVPGKRGVPVMINGRDASWAIVEGDWGLYRPGAVPVTVIYPQPRFAAPPHRYVYRCSPCRHIIHRRTRVATVHRAAGPVYVPPAQRHYFPGGATKPVLGRLEIEPKGPPKPAQSYFRSWSTESQRLPANVESSPQVVVAPSTVERRRPPRRHTDPNPRPPSRAANPTPR